MFGVGTGMLYTPILVDKMQLTLPSGYAVANILRALTDKTLLKRSIAKLGGGTLAGFVAGFGAQISSPAGRRKGSGRLQQPELLRRHHWRGHGGRSAHRHSEPGRGHVGRRSRPGCAGLDGSASTIPTKPSVSSLRSEPSSAPPSWTWPSSAANSWPNGSSTKRRRLSQEEDWKKVSTSAPDCLVGLLGNRPGCCGRLRSAIAA